MVGPKKTTDDDFYSYNVLASGETPVWPDSGGLIMFDWSSVVKYGAASAGARQTSGGQR